ncbi:MAG TPA: hypothetical protein EYG38_12335, partial [Verrucomicrobia bacterium]|nr:hypothetical protein [Verrucomicrobiota bacterium]
MEPSVLNTHLKRLSNVTPLLGAWIRKQAIRALAAEISTDTTRALIEHGLPHDDPVVQAIALAAIGNLSDPASIDLACSLWAENRQQDLDEIIAGKKWMATGPTELRVLTALRIGQLDAVTRGGAVEVYSILDARGDSDGAIAENARVCLSRLKTKKGIEAFCACWLETRDPELTSVLVQGGYQAESSPELYVYSRLKTETMEPSFDKDPRLIPFLVQACADDDDRISSSSRGFLEKLENPESRDALCRSVIEEDSPIAREICLRWNYLPTDPYQRAVFFILTDQWEPYTDLDFDQRLLATAYEGADSRVRCRLVEKARRAGRMECLEVIAGERLERRLNTMTDQEWESVILVLNENQRWEDLWRMAQAAPAVWSAKLLSGLDGSGWMPDSAQDRDEFKNLVTLGAMSDSEPPLFGRLMNCVSSLEGHTDRLSCMKLSSSGHTLVTGSCDHTCRIWPLSPPQPPLVLSGHDDWISGLVIDPMDRVVVSAGREGVIRVWNFADGRLLKTLEGDHQGEVESLAIHPDGGLLASGGSDGSIRLWDLETGRQKAVLEGHQD